PRAHQSGRVERELKPCQSQRFEREAMKRQPIATVSKGRHGIVATEQAPLEAFRRIQPRRKVGICAAHDGGTLEETGSVQGNVLEPESEIGTAGDRDGGFRRSEGTCRTGGAFSRLPEGAPYDPVLGLRNRDAEPLVVDEKPFAIDRRGAPPQQPTLSS